MADRAVALVGGGLTGLAAALAIGRTGRQTHLIDPDEGREDHRTTAMLGPTIDVLRALGVWDAIEPDTAALRTMRIIDGSRRLLRAPTVTFEVAVQLLKVAQQLSSPVSARRDHVRHRRAAEKERLQNL